MFATISTSSGSRPEALVPLNLPNAQIEDLAASFRERASGGFRPAKSEWVASRRSLPGRGRGPAARIRAARRGISVWGLSAMVRVLGVTRSPPIAAKRPMIFW